MININFFSNRISKKAKQKKQDLKMFRISTYVLIGVTLLMVATFGFKFYNALQIKQTNQEIKDYKETILGQESVEIAYLIFVNKIKVISEIYQKRSNKQEALEFFSQIFAGTADIIGMNYQEDQGGLVLQLSSDNIFKLQATNEILDSTTLRQKYREIEKTALTRTEQGSYKLGLTLELKNNDQK